MATRGRGRRAADTSDDSDEASDSDEDSDDSDDSSSDDSSSSEGDSASDGEASSAASDAEAAKADKAAAEQAKADLERDAAAAEEAMTYTAEEERMKSTITNMAGSQWRVLDMTQKSMWLEFLVKDAIERASEVEQEAQRANQLDRTHAQEIERKVRELREKSKKATGPLMRAKEDGWLEKCEQLKAETEKEIVKKIVAHYAKIESGDVGPRLRPLGEDRHRRFYWYLPHARHLLVQRAPAPALAAAADGEDADEPTAAEVDAVLAATRDQDADLAGATAVAMAVLRDASASPAGADAASSVDNNRSEAWGTPCLAFPAGAGSPGGAAADSSLAGLIDDDSDDGGAAKRKKGRGEAPVASKKKAKKKSDDELREEAASAARLAKAKMQHAWGFVSAAALPAFLASLDQRGLREAALHRAVCAVRPQVEHLEDEYARLLKAKEEYARTTRMSLRGAPPTTEGEPYENKFRATQYKRTRRQTSLFEYAW